MEGVFPSGCGLSSGAGTCAIVICGMSLCFLGFFVDVVVVVEDGIADGGMAVTEGVVGDVVVVVVVVDVVVVLGIVDTEGIV